MELYEAINRRSSVREFTDEAIPEETVKRIIRAAYKAPANDHFRDWHFIVVTDKAVMREVLEGVPKDLTEKDVDRMTFISDPVQKASYQFAVPRQYSMLMSAAAVIIPLMKKKVDVLHPANLSHLNCFASVWCSIENLWLAATAEGFGCNLRIPMGCEEELARRATGFPEEYMIPCFIGLGRPAEGAVRTKQLVADMEKQLHWQRF
jgi:nitroreductase